MRDRLRRRKERAATALLTAAITATTVIATAGQAHAANAEPDVVPSLRQWTGGTGTLNLTSASRIVVDTADAQQWTTGADSELLSHRTLTQVADRLRVDLSAVTGLSLTVATATSPANGDIFLHLDPDSGLGVEGYELGTASTVDISAPTSTGVLNAGRTLAQILRLDAGHDTVPKGAARDWPKLQYRAEHFDVSRRFMSVSAIQDEIRRAAWNKLNVVQLMFNQANAFRLYSPTYAEAAPTDPAYRYSQSDIAAIEAVAAEHHVTVVPEIQNPTKADPIATIGGVDRSLSAQCGDGSTLDFTDSGVTDWMQDMVAHFQGWFASPYIHLGNDEVPHALATCDYIEGKYTAAAPTMADLQELYIAELEQTVEAAGKKAMIWVNNTDIRPSTDVLIMNFGSTSVASTMRSAGYEVVDSAYKTGAYDRFYIAPGDYESKVVPRGDMYAWTPVSHANNVGQVLAYWGDDHFFSDTDFVLDLFDGRRSELAERTWNTDSPTRTFAQFTNSVTAIGDAPGTTPRTPPAPSTNSEPVHRWAFDSKYVPSDATHYPGGWKLSTADSLGTLHANGWLYPPTFPVAGRTGNAAGFTAGTGQTFNLGGRAIQAPWTFNAWIKRTADATNTVLVRDMSYAIKVEEYGSTNKVGITKYGTGNYAFNYTVPLSQWVMLTLVGTPTGTKLYANGALVDSLTQVIPLPLGGFGGKRPFTGLLDDVTAYRQALTATDIATLYGNYTGDLALNRPVTASSTYRTGVEAPNAVDGDSTTRWSSNRSDPQWISVDLGSTRTIDRVRLNWEAAYGKAYQIETSTDGTNWTTIYSTTTGDGGVDDLIGLTGAGRYIRVYGTQRGTVYGYSLWDFNVYGS